MCSSNNITGRMNSSNNVGKGKNARKCKGEVIRLYKVVEGSGQEQRRDGTMKPAHGYRGAPYQQATRTGATRRDKHGTQEAVVRYRRSKEAIREVGPLDQ